MPTDRELLLITKGDKLPIIQQKVHHNAQLHGWWDQQRTIPELLVLIHSEVSEALEAYRNNDRANYREELADILIRLLDLEQELILKHAANIDRPHKHGGKIL